jgi:hypothetical protein
MTDYGTTKEIPFLSEAIRRYQEWVLPFTLQLPPNTVAVAVGLASLREDTQPFSRQMAKAYAELLA